MSRHRARLRGLLAVACCAGLALVAPVTPAVAADATPQLIAEFVAHGYDSPPVALQRLQRVAPRADAGLELRWRYEAMLSFLAMLSGERDVAQQSVGRLQAMAERESCRACASLVMVRREQAAEASDDAALRRSLSELTKGAEPEDPAVRFEWFLARAGGRALLGEHEEAIVDALKASEIATEFDRPADLAAALDVLSVENATRRDVDRALGYSREGIALARKIGFGYMLARLLINESYALATKKEVTQRKADLEELLALTEGKPGLKVMYQNALINLANLSNDSRDYTRAADYAQRAERAANPEHDPNGYAFALVNHGVAEVHLGRIQEGLTLVQQAVDIGRRTGDKRELADLIEQQVDAFETAALPQDALQALRQWVKLNDEVTTSQREEALAHLQESFALKQREHEVERLTLANARRDAELQLQAWRERALAAGAALAALVALQIWRRLRRTRSANLALQGDVARLSDESQHDAMTGAFNRRHGEALLQKLGEDARRRRRKVALLLLDVDHFKSVNDTRGHAAGDAVLIELTRRLQANVRDGDAVVRWGGEEFLLILPGAEGPVLRDIADRALAAIGAQPFALPEGAPLSVRASAGGVVWVTGEGSAWPRSLALADAALYRAKGEGRNRAILAMGEVPPLAAGAEGESLDRWVANSDLKLVTVPGERQGSGLQA
jgi:diguanylate cyclase (GGDEF)-like protein